MRQFISMLSITLLFSSCIGDDIILDTVEETLKITNQATSIAVGDTFRFEGRFTNNIGEVADDQISWRSSDEAILEVTNEGLATGIAPGFAEIYAEVNLTDGETLQEQITVEVSGITTVVETPTERSGKIQTTSSYLLEGDFIVTENDNKLTIEVAENYQASTALPGLYVYLTNNPNSINDALEIGKVEVFEGAHTYQIDKVNLTEYDYLLYFCKPFRVKVGDGKIE